MTARPDLAEMPDEYYDDHDPEDDDTNDGWDECGRWDNGTLSRSCTKAGSEECDWHCPVGPWRPRPKKVRAAPLLDLMEDPNG